MLLHFVLVLSFGSCEWGYDSTLVPGSTGEDTVCEVINKIDNSNIFPNDAKMLRRIAFVKSTFGDDSFTYRAGYYGGIWQVDESGFKDVMTGSHARLDELWPQIETLLSKEKKNITWEDLRTPLFSGVFARIRLYLVNANLPHPDDLIGQAKYWKKYYNSRWSKRPVDDFVIQVNVMNKEFGSYCNMCQGRMNLAIVMDGSASIGSYNYLDAKRAAKNLIGTFSIELVDVGYVLFSSSASTIFPLRSSLTRDQMKQKIDESSYPCSYTRTDLAIDEGVAILGKADDNTGIPKVMVVFTDGQPDVVNDAISSAKRAKGSNITIFVVAIGSNIDDDVLKALASFPSYVIPVASYQDLLQFNDKINSKTCKVPQTPDIGIPVNDQLGKYEKRYFKYQIPNQGITIKINPSAGKSRGYYSNTFQLPSSAINDGMFTKEAFIPHPHMPRSRLAKREVENASLVYVTIEGLDNNNTYSLYTSDEDHTDNNTEKPNQNTKDDSILPFSNPLTTSFDVLNLLRNSSFSTNSSLGNKYTDEIQLIIDMQAEEHALRMDILRAQLETAKLNRDIAEINKNISLRNLHNAYE